MGLKNKVYYKIDKKSNTETISYIDDRIMKILEIIFFF